MQGLLVVSRNMDIRIDGVLVGWSFVVFLLLLWHDGKGESIAGAWLEKERTLILREVYMVMFVSPYACSLGVTLCLFFSLF